MKNEKKMFLKNINIKKTSCSSGFALVEVILAAVVMAVGCAAFLELQSVSLKTSSNNYSRTQAMTISSNFVEQLRGNRGFIYLPAASRSGAIVGGTVGLSTAPQSSCVAGAAPDVCAQATLDYQLYLSSLQMGAVFPNNLSLLCYQEDANLRGYLRVTFLWRDNLSTAGNRGNLAAAQCPALFNTSLASTAADNSKDNSVVMYVQL